MLENLEIASYILERDSYRGDITLDRMHGFDDNPVDRWAIRRGGYETLRTDGKWVIEATPSDRDEEYYKTHRWKTAEDAYEFWRKTNGN